MLVDVLLFVLGLGLLLGGGDALVRGASATARRAGVSPAIVGLTVVAFGTSAPELVVCVLAALRGDADIAFGNVMGSNVANLGLLLGVTALLRPLTVESRLISRELPMMLLASVAASVLALDVLLQQGADDAVRRGDGIVLLLLFGVFLFYTTADVLRSRRTDPLFEESREVAVAAERPVPWPLVTALLVGGILGLAGGGHLLVASGVSLAAALGVPAVVVGATVVAVGTSLPELATSILAARAGQTDLAVGNVVGSNIFNLLFVLGTTATIAPVAVPPGGWIDLAAMTAVAAVLVPIAVTDQHRITRREGLVLVLAYGGYISWQLARTA